MTASITIPTIHSVKDKRFLVTGGAGFIGSHIILSY
jgi:FlaA1/EpsC-like NDP-sugar epimerase